VSSRFISSGLRVSGSNFAFSSAGRSMQPE
jgi:hypothetical protein